MLPQGMAIRVAGRLGSASFACTDIPSLMSSRSTFRANDTRTSRGGGRPPVPIDPDWGGGEGRGGGDDSLPSYPERLRRARLAVCVLLASVVMVFVGFTSLMLARRGGTHYDSSTGDYVSDWRPTPLPITLLLVNTGVLALSSASLEVARRRARRHVALRSLNVPGVSLGPEREFPWLSATVLLGAVFLGGQLRAWEELHRQGIYMTTVISDSFFFILTGAHAVHLVAGMIALLAAGLIAEARRSPENYRLVLDATSTFWHSMGVLWLYLLGLIYWGAAA